MSAPSLNRRILVVDDNPAIHEDFRKILSRTREAANQLAHAEAELFGDTPADPTTIMPEGFDLSSALQGQEALEKVREAQSALRPFAMAFMDIRMPPGWDGIETTLRLWEEAPDLEVVICTAHTDYSWQDMLRQLAHPDRFLVLKKPFEAIEVLQLAHSLTAKWELGRQARLRQEQLEKMVQERTEHLQNALAKVKTLTGLLPICASCKKIRDDTGYWNQVESYIGKHSSATFTHGLCPTCITKYFPDYDPNEPNPSGT